jgi:hypothetical protein
MSEQLSPDAVGICCGWRRRTVSVAIDRQFMLTMAICDVCQQRQWHCNEVPISHQQAIDLAISADAGGAQLVGLGI